MEVRGWEMRVSRRGTMVNRREMRTGQGGKAIWKWKVDEGQVVGEGQEK